MALYVLLLVFIVLTEVSSQVCTETKSVLRKVNETYQYTYYEAYEEAHCLIYCTLSKRAVNVGTRQVEKLVNETVSVCCEGYITDDSYKGDGIKCIPLCNPPCENGYCRNPNECACEPGYAVDPNDALKRCVPLCLDGCNTPGCLSTCQSSDYDYDTPETDMCDNTCLNGTCVAPGVCHCNSGYKRFLDACKPICTACDHGKCVSPGICKCDFGWHEECGTCKPICSGCEHGICKAPGQCECDPGYKARNAKCEPFCQNCDGICVAPDLCACDSGWYLNRLTSRCEPHCDVACGNGSCVAPNLCKCYAGYREKYPHEGDGNWYNTAPRCVPDCTDCRGLCVAPGTCKCDVGYESFYTTADGKECECVDCTNKSCEMTCRKINKENAVKKIDELATPSNNTDEIMSFANTTLKGVMNRMNIPCDTKNVKFTYHWVYIAIIVFELILIIIMLVILERRNKFTPKDKHAEVAVHYTSPVTCSKIKSTEFENS